MIQLSNALQNIKSTLYNLRNVCKVQYITKFITRITKMESLFYTKINNKTFKHYKSQNDTHDNALNCALVK